MSDEDPAAIRADVIESMERSAEVYGLSRSAGRVYGVLYFAESPLSIPELVDETGYAKSTISNVTRKLTRIGLIRRRSSGGGGRRVRFEPERDLWFVLRDVFRQYLRREMDLTRRTLDGALDRLEDLDERDADEDLDERDVSDDLERVRELQDTYGEFQTLLDLATDHSVGELIEAIERYDAQ
jgi:DNA-binding transcriptional regulator GbsR (MarR family)